MPISPARIRAALDGYRRRHPTDGDLLQPAYDLLEAGADLTSRKEFRGHATAGALLIDDRRRVLLMRHRVLETWLFPGGHLEVDDESLQSAALRELAEETGIGPDEVEALAPHPVHIDIHPIPANPSKDEPAHRHIDFRFAFRGSSDVRALQLDEVVAAEWRPLAELPEVLRERVNDALP